MDKVYQLIKSAKKASSKVKHAYDTVTLRLYPEFYWPRKVKLLHSEVQRAHHLQGLFIGTDFSQFWREVEGFSAKLMTRLYESTSSPPQLFYWTTGFDVRGNYKYPGEKTSTEYELSGFYKPLETEKRILFTVLLRGNPGLLGAKYFYQDVIHIKDKLHTSNLQHLEELTELNPQLSGLILDRIII